jgi:transcription elongation factor S-II
LNKILNELKKSSDKSIAAGAKAVVEAYKTQLRGAVAAPAQPLATTAQTPTATKRKADSPADEPSAKRPLARPRPTPSASTTTAASPSAKRPASTTTYELGLTGAELRNKAQKLIYEALGKDDDDSTTFRTELAFRIEAGIQAHFLSEGGFTSPSYKSRLRVILGNLRDTQNPDINQRLYFGELEPEIMASMSEFDMASQEMKTSRANDVKELIEARKTDLSVGTVGTDMFQCPKCKARKANYYQRQTRSADEPMTIFLTCLMCRHRWRQY